MRYALLIFLLAVGLSGILRGNGIFIQDERIEDELITNPDYDPNVPGSISYFINASFTVFWENSWRISSGPSNWDGAYLFARYRENGGPWKNLAQTTPYSNTGWASVNVPGGGMIVYPTADRTGSVALGIDWRGGIPDASFDPNATIDVRFYAVEMVWIPEASYTLGTDVSISLPTFGNTFFGRAGNLNFDPPAYRVNGEFEIPVGGTSGLNIAQNSASAGDNSGTLPAAYPKGYAGFWIMKYEVSQQQYVDFFNSLTPDQQAALDPTGNDGKGTNSTISRNGCSITDGVMNTSRSLVAMNYVNDRMMLAYLDWAGLRPVSELEYEKAGRGIRPAVYGEYAWGTTGIASNTYTAVSLNAQAERFTGASTTEGNALYSATTPIAGPARVGAIAASPASPGRVVTGASYYGVMDLSGNLREWTVSAGEAAGRAFQDQPGDYELGPQGQAVPRGGSGGGPRWPQPGQTAWALRGGAYNDAAAQLRLSDRTFGSVSHSQGTATVGFRGAIRSGLPTPQ